MQYPATHNSSRSVQEPLLLQNISFNGARKPAKSMHGVNKPRHTANGLSTSVSALPKRLLAALAGVLTLSLAGILYSYRTQHSELPIMGERDDDFYLMFHAESVPL